MKRTLAIFVATASLTAATTPALAADVSANIGWNSQYIFRGILQSKSSAMAGVDLEAGGFYVGAWGADVDDGLEIDYYGGYNFDLGPVSLGVGGTLYTYTGDFDDTYKELNFSAGFAFLTFDAAVGSYDNFDGPSLDYEFYSLTAEHNGFYGTVGTFQNDFSGNYLEAGYGNTLSVGETDLLDYVFTVVHSDEDLAGGDSSDTSFVLTLSKTFDF
ncbi:MAG: TorF family putative porin [Xanthomonadales bacterium]